MARRAAAVGVDPARCSSGRGRAWAGGPLAGRRVPLCMVVPALERDGQARLRAAFCRCIGGQSRNGFRRGVGRHPRRGTAAECWGFDTAAAETEATEAGLDPVATIPRFAWQPGRRHPDRSPMPGREGGRLRTMGVSRASRFVAFGIPSHGARGASGGATVLERVHHDWTPGTHRHARESGDPSGMVPRFREDDAGASTIPVRRKCSQPRSRRRLIGVSFRGVWDSVASGERCLRQRLDWRAAIPWITGACVRQCKDFTTGAETL